jgi:predicted metalloprotease with PDZ domain
MFCLDADVRIREETRGRKSLDDAVRAALERGGDATRVWTIGDVLKVGDAATGTNVLGDMYAHYAARGERIDFESLLSAIGVAADGRDPDDSRPLAWVRHGIVDLPPQALAQGTPLRLLGAPRSRAAP